MTSAEGNLEQDPPKSRIFLPRVVSSFFAPVRANRRNQEPREVALDGDGALLAGGNWKPETQQRRL
jgi:hypothetical protein